MQKLDLKKPKTDLFDRLEYTDVFDRVELPTEEKVAYSGVMKDVLREEFQKLIASLPIPSMISKAMEKMAARQMKSESGTRETLEKTISDIRGEIGKLDTSHKKERDEIIAKLRKSLDELRTEVRQPRYEFGGFSPQANDLNIGDPSAEGAYRIVKSGSNLSIQRLESGTWTEKFAVTP